MSSTAARPARPRCGATTAGATALSFVRVGTLDEPAAAPPDVHIYTRSKLPWVVLPEGVPAFEEYYDSRALWPPESLARRKAALSAEPRPDSPARAHASAAALRRGWASVMTKAEAIRQAAPAT